MMPVDRMMGPPVPAEFKVKLRTGFSGLFILAGGFDAALGELVERGCARGAQAHDGDPVCSAASGVR